MADGTLIEWAAVPGYRPATLNPAPGCRRVSPGCQGCYAERVARRQILMARAQGRTSLIEAMLPGLSGAAGWTGR